MNAIIEQHAQQRIEERLTGLVTIEEVKTAALRANAQKTRYWEVKKVVYTEVNDPTVKPDGVARGDQIVIVIDYDKQTKTNIVRTVSLRKSWSNSGEYNKIMKAH